MWARPSTFRGSDHGTQAKTTVDQMIGVTHCPYVTEATVVAVSAVTTAAQIPRSARALPKAIFSLTSRDRLVRSSAATAADVDS